MWRASGTVTGSGAVRGRGPVYEGPFVEGQLHGDWVYAAEGPYVEGGRGAYTYSEGPYVEGQRHGDWVYRYANGNVQEGPYVEGQRHRVTGSTATRTGPLAEGPYVEGERHGDWVWRFADGNVEEGPYVEGERHGDWVIYTSRGVVEEGPYVEGQLILAHGHWVWRRPNGDVEELWPHCRGPAAWPLGHPQGGRDRRELFLQERRAAQQLGRPGALAGTGSPISASWRGLRRGA